MKRFIAIAAVLLIALSTGLMGVADLHRGPTGDVPGPKMAEAHAVGGPVSGHMHGHGEGKDERVGYHTSCAIAGHSCAGYVTPELGAVASLSYSRQDWSAPTHRLAAGLNAEASTPPPRA